jgi:hypothetical protein
MDYLGALARARLSKQLVTIRDDLPIQLDVERLRVQPPRRRVQPAAGVPTRGTPALFSAALVVALVAAYVTAR